MDLNTITGKDIIGWIVVLLASFISALGPLLVFYFAEYKKSKQELKESDKKQNKELEKLNGRLLREVEGRKDLEKKVIENELKLTNTLNDSLGRMLNKNQKDLQKKENVEMKLMEKLYRNKIIVEQIDIDETSFEEWKKQQEKNKK